MKNKDIKIIDWTCAVLFEGPYDSELIDTVLDANRCNCDYKPNCEVCNETGYNVDIEVLWVDEEEHKNDNVYDFINY